MPDQILPSRSAKPQSSDEDSESTDSDGEQYDSGPCFPRHYYECLPVAKIPCHPHGLIRRPVKLFGVDDILRHMHNVLWKGSIKPPGTPTYSRLKAFMLSGKVGHGKTEIAREFVFRHRNKFDAIAWLVAESKAALEEGFAKFAVQLQLTSPTERDNISSKDELFYWLSEPIYMDSGDACYAKWLLVLDNVEYSDTIMDFWDDLSNGQGSILLLKREPLFRSQGSPNIECLDLPPLDEKNAAQLFQAVAEIESSEDIEKDSLGIVRDWECIPLAIVHVAIIFRNSSRSLKDFKQYQVTHRRILRSRHTGGSADLALIWAVEVRARSERALLGVLCFFHHNEISERVLTRSWDAIKISHYPKGKEYENCRDLLRRDRLIGYVSDKEGNVRLYMQQFVQDSIRNAILLTAGTVNETFNAVARLVLSAWPTHLTKGTHMSQEKDIISRWEQSSDLLPHGKRLRQVYTALKAVDQQACATRELACLFVEISWYQRERCMISDCLNFLEAAFSVLEQSTEDMKDLLSAAHNARGALALQINQPKEALRHYREYLRVSQETYKESGKATPQYAAAFSELGMARLMNKQCTNEVFQLFETSESIRRGLEGYKKLDLFNTLRGKAYCHWLRGELNQAFSYLDEALGDREREFGPDDKQGIRTGTLLMNLGNVTYLQQKYASSASYHERAMTQLESVLGWDSVGTADVKFQVARHCLRLDDPIHSAEQLLGCAIERYSRTIYFKGELARAKFAFSKALKKRGDSQRSLWELEGAGKLRDSLTRTEIPIENLKEGDFDELVVFWKV